MMAEAAPDLMVLVAELAAELGDTSAVGDHGVVAYQRAEQEFARVSADALEVRLPEDIAEAALRTPDTSMVVGSGGWVRFTPRGTERHVTDRAAAWFRTAWRYAGER